MRRASGRVAIGLVLASTWAGACLSEQDTGELAPAVAMEPLQSAAAQARAGDIVVGVRSHLQRAFKGTNVRVPGERMPNISVNSFDLVGHQLAPQAEAVMFGGATIESHASNRADLELPSRADGPFRLRDATSGVSIEVNLRGAGNAAREDSDGYVAYPSGFGSNAHIVHRPTAQGTEDYIYFAEKLPETPELHYDVALGEKVAGVRFVAQSIELLDADGTPRLRMAPPYAVDGDGRKVSVNVALDGCAYDESPRAPWRRPTVNPGATHCAVHLSWPNDVKAPLVVDPVWSLTTDMMAVRFRHTSTSILVPTPVMGEPAKPMVLVAGGDNGTPGQSLNTAELFDETTKTWASTPPMPTFHSEHAAVASGSNSVYIIGGRGNSNGTATAAVSKYQISSGTWGMSTQMGVPRWGHTATLVENGARILVTGGFTLSGIPIKDVEIFASPVWTPFPFPMTTARAGHIALIVEDTKVLVLGGEGEVAPIASVELCDTVQAKCGTGFPGTPPPMLKPRSYYVGSRLGTRLYVFGGGPEAQTAEYFDPQKMPPTWQPLPNMKNPRVFHSLAHIQPLSTARLLITGGIGMNDQALKTAEMFDVGKLAWTVEPVIPDMNHARAFHTSNALADGRVLVMGGSDDKAAEIYHCTEDNDCPQLPNTKYYCGKEGRCLAQKPSAAMCDPAQDCYGETCTMCSTGHCADGVCCNVACDGVCESCDQDNSVGQCLVAPKGPPRKGHDRCLPDGFTAKDIPCEGKCDGITRDSCEYIEGKSCGTLCVDDKDRLVPSTNTELVCSAEGFCLEGQVSSTCGEYICADPMSCRIDCSDTKQCLAGYLCSNKICIPGQTTCGDADGLENNVVVSTLPGIEDVRCEPYRCESGACKNVCETAYDCLPVDDGKGNLINYACDENRTCVPINETITDGEVSCALSPDQQSSRFGWLAAIALAGAIAARRNRPRA